MDESKLAITLARGRIGIGIAAVLTPGLATRALTFRKAEGAEPPLARMLGARDLALGLGVVIALDHGAPVRGWLEAGALADTVDLISAVIAKDRFNPIARKATIAGAAGAAATGVYLSRRLDPAPEASPGQPEAIVTGHHEPPGVTI